MFHVVTSTALYSACSQGTLPVYVQEQQARISLSAFHMSFIPQWGEL